MSIEALIAKKPTQDCTEEESAEIKALLADIARLFPLEWDEAHAEMVQS